MKTSDTTIIKIFMILCLFIGCTSSFAVEMPDVPSVLRPTRDQELFLETLGIGVQIYECSVSKTQPTGFEWVFKSPEANLFDNSGKKIGIHYAGPTWELNDGSKVIGEVKARDIGPDASSIPWLLLYAKSVSGTGVMSRTKSILRVKTVGGKSPSEACDQSHVNNVVRVPYKAAYYFFNSKQ